MPSVTHEPDAVLESGSWRGRILVPWLSAVLAVFALAGAANFARTVGRAEADRAGTLWQIATAFNRDYAANRPGAVYDRFDAASRAVISRAAYVRRHLECPDPPGAATTRGVVRGSAGYWLVHYEIAGVGLTDYWHEIGGKWRFSLVRSNPQAVALYRAPFAAYARALGCTPGA